MRPSCLDCARKHLAQACILMMEAAKGYPEYRILVIGHMAEAEDEMIKRFPEKANMIRDTRILYENGHIVDMMELIKNVTGSNTERVEENNK